MTNHDPVLALLAEANPAADSDEPPVQVMSKESLLDVVHDRVGSSSDLEVAVPVRGNPWRGPALALGVACLVLLLALPIVWVARWNESGPPAGSIDSIPATGEATTPVTWDPALRETTARAVDVLEACPPGTDPDALGTNGETGPRDFSGNPANQRAAFDAMRGLIVLLDGRGETWTFDVCTNSWTEMRADDTPWLLPFERRFDEGGRIVTYTGDLVHDIDSGRTIALGNLGYYDYGANTWWNLSSQGRIKGRDMLRGAVYDPVSGLVIVAHHTETHEPEPAAPTEAFEDPVTLSVSLSSYDVDTDTWNLIGVTEVAPWSFLIGYSPTIDRLIFIEPGPGHDNLTDGNAPRTSLVDPRTGRTDRLDVQSPDIFAAWGVWYPYAVGVDGAVVIDEDDGSSTRFGQGDVCVFDPASLSWGGSDGCRFDSFDGPKRSVASAAKVYDPINERLVFVLWTGDVWALDLDSGEWIELL